jgi:fermentation-respiration switch protein FrsA (DUF1100 family)
MIWLVVLFVIGFGYLAVALVFAARQERLFFQPKRGHAAAPGEAQLAHDDLALTTPDGVALHAWWLPGPDDPAGERPGRPFTMLFLHGANTNLGDRVPTLRFWHDLGFDILAIDYRGYGRSGGRPTEQGLYRDVRTAWDWLTGRRGVTPGRIVIAAESMGVSLATHLGLEVRPAAMVLEAGFTCARDVAARRYPWLPVRQMLRLDLDSEERIGRIRCPKLLVHSVDDTLVPITLGRRLERRAAPPKDFLKVRGSHAQACREGGPRYADRLRRWLADLDVSDGVA